MDVQVNGAVAEGFEPVGEAFAANFRTLGERGAALAVYRDGHRVVDLWGGTRDVDGTLPWERGTAQIVRSATKGVVSAALLLLHQRGELDLDAPVRTYWPEYKAAGKEHTRVRDLLAHRAGVPVLDRPLTPAEAADPDLAAAAVAAQAPVWEPGTAHGYHAQTFSWLTGELVRRVTGRSAGAWIAEHLAGPAAADFWLGLPAAEAHRVGRVGRSRRPSRRRPARPPQGPSPTPTPTPAPSPGAPSPRSPRCPTRTTPPTARPSCPPPTASPPPTAWPGSTPR